MKVERTLGGSKPNKTFVVLEINGPYKDGKLRMRVNVPNTYQHAGITTASGLTPQIHLRRPSIDTSPVTAGMNVARVLPSSSKRISKLHTAAGDRFTQHGHAATSGAERGS